MSSANPSTVTETLFQKKDKKSKREKGEHKSKKRQREADGEPDDEHNHKRSRSEILANGESGQKTDKKSKKHKKKRQTQQITEETQEPTSPIQPPAPTEEVSSTGATAEDSAERKKRKQEKKEKRRKERELKFRSQEGGDGDADTTQAREELSNQASAENDDGMDLDVSPAKTPVQKSGKLPEKPYPFFTQRVSQYLPLYPLGMIEPLEGYADQHLKPLLNHYVPTFKGVLLGYHDVEIGEAPGKGSITDQSEMADEAMLESIDEYAVGFGWLTAKVDLFRPSRGAWLEGSINLQSEGHLGVVCWGMFNASIEATRLPEGWKWINLLGKGKGRGRDKTPEEAKLPTPEPADEGEEDVSQLHTTGYWVDDNGQRVKGALRFQIKNFEVGVSGDYGYLSIEGTMLDESAEKMRTASEVEAARRRKLRKGGSRSEMKRLPEFSMTKFGMDEKEEEQEEPKLVDA